MLSRRLIPIIGLALAMAAPAHAQDRGPPVTVFAAASLKNAFEEAGAAFTAETKVPVRFSFAASSALARQIEQGAPADLFASADVEWMNFLVERRLVQAGTRTELLGNRLVVVAPREPARPTLELTADSILRALGPDGRIATGEVTSVPAGRYAKAALEKLGLWESVRPRLAQAENVRAALAFVARGEAPLGIVYETDAKAEPKVEVAAAFPAGSHPPVTYPFALTASAKGDAPARLLSFLGGAPARAIFERHGFTALRPARSGS